MNTFPWTEIGLARVLGVSREQLRAFRNEHLAENTDWTTDKKNVRYSEKAAQDAVAFLGAVWTGPAEETPQAVEMVNEDAPKKGWPEDMEVVRRMVNPHLIECQTPAGAKVLVKVTHNENFRPGMNVRAEADGPSWRLVGRCPRFPGRW
jgi:hypothetical protein